MASRIQVDLTAEEITWLVNAARWILSDPFAVQELTDGQADTLRGAVRRLETAAPPPSP